VKLDHLYAITDHSAVVQHATFSVPAKREGYAVDDNARALVVAVKALALWPDERLSELQRKLLAFILLMQAKEGQFHNLMDFSQRIIDEPSVGDHLGRAIWSTGVVINSSLPSGMKNSARQIFDRALPWGRATRSLRTKAYTCLGLAERLKAEPADQNLILNLTLVASDLIQEYVRYATENWNWFENVLTYDNARLSQALFVAYEALGVKTYLDTAEKSLRFLLRATTRDETHVPIGNDGWYPKGGTSALYDQQPVDAGAMIETTALAYKITGNTIYEKGLRQSLGWFFGLNTKSVVVYDASTGACHDGITPAGLNENQGAEATISFLLGASAAIEKLAESR